MSQAHKYLYDEISKLPLEKIGKVLSYARYVSQEPDEEIWLGPAEDDEPDALYESGDFVDASAIEAKIEAILYCVLIIAGTYTSDKNCAAHNGQFGDGL